MPRCLIVLSGHTIEMLPNRSNVRIAVKGDYGLFTRPEAHVERFSYDCLTPSAARNICDAILWKPEFRWVVTSIAVLKPIQFMSIRRNEVQSKLSPASVRRWMSDPTSYQPLAAGAGEGTDGTPRNSVVLRDVAYLVEAYPLVYDTSGDNTPQKYVAMFNRRLAKGQHYTQPYLGVREFAARVEPATGNEVPISLTRNCGRMLYDIIFRPGNNRPVFFEANLVNGSVDTRPESVIPDPAVREEVLRCSSKL